MDEKKLEVVSKPIMEKDLNLPWLSRYLQII